MGNKIITQIRVIDLYTNGTGGIPIIISGGLGQTFVVITLSGSAPGLGYNFLTDIHGN